MIVININKNCKKTWRVINYSRREIVQNKREVKHIIFIQNSQNHYKLLHKNNITNTTWLSKFSLKIPLLYRGGQK